MRRAKVCEALSPATSATHPCVIPSVCSRASHVLNVTQTGRGATEEKRVSTRTHVQVEEALPDATRVAIMFPAGRFRLHESNTDADSRGITILPSYSMYLAAHTHKFRADANREMWRKGHGDVGGERPVERTGVGKHDSLMGESARLLLVFIA